MPSSRTTMSSITASLVFVTIFTTLLCPSSSFASKPHVINFRSPNLYPESLTWDSSAQHFVVGSLRHRTVLSVSDAAVVDTLISDPLLPPNSSLLGLALDQPRRRLLAAVHSPPSPYSSSSALAAYDLPSRRRLFLTPLHEPSATDSSAGANDVAVDFSGNAYVTNSAGNLIWKVNLDGEATILSRSPLFTANPVEGGTPYSSCGLNGIAYISKGYLLVVQSNTGKLFKVNADDGATRTVLLNKDLRAGDGIAVRRDGVVVVVSSRAAYFIKSESSWSDGAVYDETALDEKRFATSVTVGAEDRVYVLYGHVMEGMMGTSEREEFSIVEIESGKESEGEAVWVYVLLGLGLAYFLFWRFQMRQLVSNMNKKTA
ncbi:hypothetical protein RJ639_013744 [Escallonia herrerae]|uniref:SMP-30/Gluconolactonase/LRE-like region domain-containing protein n=1 Tax=Escallonia herrerae TaxID=1293975 RepID=A0AA88VJM6_9ASTE|nr:hypothetical protein RJ639_013744 [Escallonia herrerae]